jgi:hypothetical protein
MTLYEIYLDYRTAPVGSVGPPAAIAETAPYAGGWLAASWGAGYAFGTEIHNLIEEFDPALDDVICILLALLLGAVQIYQSLH